MKRMLIALGVASLMGLMGCDEDTVETVNGHVVTHKISGYTLSRVRYDGHIYIIRDGFHQSGMVHDPDCPCHVKEKVEK